MKKARRRHSYRRDFEAKQRAKAWFTERRQHFWGHRFSNGFIVRATAGKYGFSFDAPFPSLQSPKLRAEAQAWQRYLYKQVANDAEVIVFWALPETPEKLTECVEPDQGGGG